MPADPWTVVGAGLVEGVVGYPAWLHARLPHPVAWVATLIGGLERFLNRTAWSSGARRTGGVLCVVVVTGVAGALGFVLDHFLGRAAWGAVGVALLGAFGLAARSLFDHVAAVDRALAESNLDAARAAVGRIVGRDVAGLDTDGIATAALESLAESFCDGLIAPLFWFLIGGLAGLFAYKAVNTADSLIGHREAPYTHFGWAAARLDDVMNLVPARLAGAFICLVAGRGWAVMRRDAPGHLSPNAGWPEAAMAGALGVRLGGPVSYDGAPHPRPYFGDGPTAGPIDLTHGLRSYVEACAVIAALLIAAGFLWPR